MQSGSVSEMNAATTNSANGQVLVWMLEGLVSAPTQKRKAWYTPAQMFGMKMRFLHTTFFLFRPMQKIKIVANGLNENTNLPYLTVGGAYGKTKISRFIHGFQAK